MSQPFTLDHQQTDNLAGSMDDVSHRIVDLMSRYREAIENMQASQHLVGDAGSQNVLTATDVTDAQNKVQGRFKQINDVLRKVGADTAHTDSDAHAALQQVAGSISFQS
ncbi:hypothetical protein GCM10009856_38410 [Mycolicibacterium llatzerense]